MQTTVIIDCPIPGLEGVTVAYNMMASADDLYAFQREIGSAKTAAKICEVNGWDAERYGADPFGSTAPMAFRVWASKPGMNQAVLDYASNPDFFTKSSRGMRATKAER